MNALTALETRLAEALAGIAPVAPEDVLPDAATGHVLARDAVLPGDRPVAHEALRAGFAVSALDLVGASSQIPVPLSAPLRVVPGMSLPPGTDAVLPADGIEDCSGTAGAIRPINPGDGIRRAGHDGRAGETLLRAGSRVEPRQRLAAELAGIDRLSVRRPRVRIDLPDPILGRFATDWACALGAVEADGAPDLTVRVTPDHRPRLALMPAETAWLERQAASLVLTVPSRFDGMLAALLALALPALVALGGASLRSISRPLARNLPSAVGMAELVFLSGEDDVWVPAPAGLVSLTGIARAGAFAILPAESEGFPAGSALPATPLDAPFE